MIKTFNEFFKERSSLHTFLDWVVKEGVYLPDHLLKQEAEGRAHNMIMEWPWSKKKAPAAPAKVLAPGEDEYGIPGTPNDDPVGREGNRMNRRTNPGSPDYVPETPEQAAARKQRRALRDTKPLPGQSFKFGPMKDKENAYTGQSQNFYNTAVTSIQGLIGRQPQFKKQLATILQSLQGVFKQAQSQAKPMLGQAASPGVGANSAKPEVQGNQEDFWKAHLGGDVNPLHRDWTSHKL